jgi:hypothetical protein
LVVAAIGVVSIWLARERPVERGLVFEPPNARDARPQAARPPLSARYDLGVPATRAFLGRGFGPDETQDGRTVVLATEARATFNLNLAPDAGGARLRLLVRTPPNTAPTRAEVRVNDALAGSLEVGPDWALRTLELNEQWLAGGRNVLEFRVPPAAPRLLFDWLWVDALSSRLELDIGTPGTRSLLTGFEPDLTLASRAVAFVHQDGGRVTARLRPLDTDYVWALVAYGNVPTGTPVSLFVNQLGIGEARFGTFDARFKSVRRLQIHAGTNTLELAPAAGTRLALDQCSLVPLESGTLVDVGTRAARPYLASGFSDDERCEPGSCVWSEGNASRVSLLVRPLPGPYELSFHSHALAALAPLTVTVTLNGHTLELATLGSSFQVRTLKVPTGVLVDGENTLEFRFAKTARPAESLAGSKDERQLAVAFDWIDLEPAADR